MARLDRSKRALGGAIKRTFPSRAATILMDRGLARGRVLDYGCGYGFDADHFGWASYDPYYRPNPPDGPFDTITCIGVINALSRNNRGRVLDAVRDLLSDGGAAYLAVPRDIPVIGKMGMHHSMQHYVVLTLDSVYRDDQLEIYALDRNSRFKDRTIDCYSLRDRRRGHQRNK